VEFSGSVVMRRRAKRRLESAHALHILFFPSAGFF